MFWPVLKFHLLRMPLHVKACMSLGDIFVAGRNKRSVFGSSDGAVSL